MAETISIGDNAVNTAVLKLSSITFKKIYKLSKQ